MTGTTIHRTRVRTRGIALYEVLIAVAIVGTSLISVMTIADNAMIMSARSQRLARASVLAQNELAWWRAAGGDKLLALGEGEHPFANAAAAANGAKTATIVVRKVEAGIVELVARVAVESGRAGVPCEVALTTWLPTGGGQ
jgi:hypothetical protein